MDIKALFMGLLFAAMWASAFTSTRMIVTEAPPLLSLTLRHIPAGVAYAAWSGLGIVLIAAVGWLFYGQRLDAPALIGMALIVVGVLLMNLSSTSAGH